MYRPIKVLICDDHTLFRQGVRTVLSTKDDIQIVGEAVDGSDLLYKLRSVKPDVILLDINMPNMDGLAVLPILKSNQEYQDIKVIILSMHNQMSMVSKMMSLGANSYLTKSDDSELIYEAIVSCYTNDYFFNELTNKALLKSVVSNPDIFEQDEEFLQIEQKRAEKVRIKKDNTHDVETPKNNIFDFIVRGATTGFIVSAVLIVCYFIYLIYLNFSKSLNLNNFNP
jgi:DNA-binding NarL/FixJ family response regulator